MAFMRNFEDRKAEIIRRSRQRIRRRKQITAWAASTALLCVLVLGTWLALPRYRQDMSDVPAIPEAAAPEEQTQQEWSDICPPCVPEQPTQDQLPEPSEYAIPAEPVPEAAEQDSMEPYTGPVYVEELGRYGSDYPGIYLEFSNLDLDTMTADIFWRNETEQTAYYSAHFRVERLVGEEWVYCAPEPLPFTDEGYELAPRGENHHTYNLDRFELSQPGSYRIAADFTLAGDAVYTLWAGFTLIGEERNEEMDMDPAGYGLDPCGCIVDGPLDPTESP